VKGGVVHSGKVFTLLRFLKLEIVEEGARGIQRRSKPQNLQEIVAKAMGVREDNHIYSFVTLLKSCYVHHPVSIMPCNACADQHLAAR